jgi:hypothetical protein
MTQNLIMRAALVLLGAASLAVSALLPAASAAAEPACQTLVTNLRNATIASRSVDQGRLTEAVACLQNSARSAPAAQPANGVSAVSYAAGILYPLSFLPFPPIDFCDALLSDGTVNGEPGSAWYGIIGVAGAYTTASGRTGVWLGTFLFASQGVLESGPPPAFVTFIGFGTSDTLPCVF